MRRKSISGIEIKDAERGEVEAVFSTLGVIDSDGDVTRPGAFTDGAEVRISAYNHASWGSALPVGKGTIREQGNEAIFEGQFFMDTEAGRETFKVIKALGGLGEWSYGYDVVDSERGTQDGREVEFLTDVKVHEVSPVLLGAGVNTRTIGVKGAERPECDAIKDRVAQLTGADAGELPDPADDEGLRDYDARLEVEAVSMSLAEPDAKQLADDVRRRLQDAGAERFGADDTYVYVDDFDIDAGFAVFCVSSDTDHRYVQVQYSRTEDGVELGVSETEVDRTTMYEPKGAEPSGRKLSDHLADAIASAEEVTERLRDVNASRAEKGKSIGEASQEAAERLESALKALREVLASAATADVGADAWGEGLEIEDQLQRARL